MAWRSSGSSNQSLIDNLEKNGLIETKRVKDAMLSTARTSPRETPTTTDRSP